MTLLQSSLACKFGGSSVADAAQIRKIAAIVRADPRRRYVVVSAPGKRHSGDDKITDLLYQCQYLIAQGESVQSAFGKIRDRFESMGAELGVSGVSTWIDEAETGLSQGATVDWAASRGEYLSARLIAAFLNARFVDATEGIRFTSEGRLDPRHLCVAARRFSRRRVVRDTRLLRAGRAGTHQNVLAGRLGCERGHCGAGGERADV